MIRILLADDQALIRSGIRALLEAEDDIEVVAEAADGRQAVALATAHHPDIALVDIQMPVLDGLEATRLIAADSRLDSVRVVILTRARAISLDAGIAWLDAHGDVQALEYAGSRQPPAAALLPGTGWPEPRCWRARSATRGQQEHQVRRPEPCE